MSKSLILLPLILTSGCLLDPKATHQGEVQQKAPEITVNIPPLDPALKDSAGKAAEGVKAEINTRMKTVQDSISGLITGKIDEVKDLVKLEAKVDARAQLDARLSAVLQAIGKLETTINGDLTNTATAQADVRASLKGLSENLIALRADLKVSVDGVQTGIANRIEKKMEILQQDIKANSGRDTNFFPPQAVEVMKSQYHVMIIVILTMKAILLAIAGYVYKSTKSREENYARLLMKAMGEISPDRAKELSKEM